MKIPQSLIHSLKGIKGFDEQAFINVHESALQITSVRFNPCKITEPFPAYLFEENLAEAIPWCGNGYYLKQRPSFTFDPLFHAGCYYVQEASSMFLEQALKQGVDLSQPLKVLDLCAAPGGKSTHIQSLISKDSLLVSNEVIRQRMNVLKDNIIKWGSSNVLVSNNDPKDFAALDNYFDVIIVDAPCSGSGLFRRDEEAIKEWSENNVVLCSQRQQRILADVLPALKENGIIIYSTCSYSKEENENVVDWLTTAFDLSSVRLKIEEDWNITQAKTEKQNYGYRFWPDQTKGEGFFLSVLKKAESGKRMVPQKNKIKALSKKEREIIIGWMNIEDKELVIFGEIVYAWPKNLFSDFDFLAQHLNIIYSGTALGVFARDKFIPEHALAMTAQTSDEIIHCELDRNNAIAYLQRKDISINTSQKGWQLATYKAYGLGWMNVLANRINNYYPKELRILNEFR